MSKIISPARKSKLDPSLRVTHALNRGLRMAGPITV